MMCWNWGWGAWAAMAAAMVAIWGLIALGIVMVVRAFAPGSARGARRILDERLARGEITTQQYEELRRALQG